MALRTSSAKSSLPCLVSWLFLFFMIELGRRLAWRCQTHRRLPWTPILRRRLCRLCLKLQALTRLQSRLLPKLTLKVRKKMSSPWMRWPQSAGEKMIKLELVVQKLAREMLQKKLTKMGPPRLKNSKRSRQKRGLKIRLGPPLIKTKTRRILHQRRARLRPGLRPKLLRLQKTMIF